MPLGLTPAPTLSWDVHAALSESDKLRVGGRLAPPRAYVCQVGKIRVHREHNGLGPFAAPKFLQFNEFFDCNKLRANYEQNVLKGLFHKH